VDTNPGAETERWKSELWGGAEGDRTVQDTGKLSDDMHRNGPIE